MRIPKPVNTALDWAEAHRAPVAWVAALVFAAGAGLLLPSVAGRISAAFVLGLALGGFVVHLRGGRRIDRARAEIDDLLRQNGRLRHRNTVLTSGIITRESAATQALMSIPEDDELIVAEGAPQATQQLPALLDEILGEIPDDEEPSVPTRPRTIRGEVAVELDNGPGDTAPLRRAARRARDREEGAA